MAVFLDLINENKLTADPRAILLDIILPVLFLQEKTFLCFLFRQMIECSMCKEWFHRMCERVNANQYEKDNMDDWYCSECTTRK